MLMRIRQNLNCCLLKTKRAKWSVAGTRFVISRKRKCAFSLDFRPIGPSIFDGVRSKVVLCGEGYAWISI